MSFLALFPLFWGVRKHFAHTLGQRGVQCTSPKLCGGAPATIVQKQSRCEGPESAGNGKKWRFLHFFANCWGFSRLQSPVGPGHCAHLPPMGLWCARGHAAMPTVGGGAAKMAGLGPKTAQNGLQMAVFAPKQPPMAGACGQMASFVLFVLGGHAKAPFVAI